jgi:hypothetical protein
LSASSLIGKSGLSGMILAVHGLAVAPSGLLPSHANIAYIGANEFTEILLHYLFLDNFYFTF